MLKSICNFRAACWVLTGAFLLAACHRSTIPSTTTTSPGTDTGAFEQTPVWADEFNTSGKPDTAKWSYDTGGSGWGNYELLYYTAGPYVEVKNGVLVLEAR